MVFCNFNSLLMRKILLITTPCFEPVVLTTAWRH